MKYLTKQLKTLQKQLTSLTKSVARTCASSRICKDENMLKLYMKQWMKWLNTIYIHQTKNLMSRSCVRIWPLPSQKGTVRMTNWCWLLYVTKLHRNSDKDAFPNPPLHETDHLLLSWQTGAQVSNLCTVSNRKLTICCCHDKPEHKF